MKTWYRISVESLIQTVLNSAHQEQGILYQVWYLYLNYIFVVS